MQIKIYADVLFLVNFGMDYLLLVFTARMLRKKHSPLRLTAAAVLGAAYALGSFFVSANLRLHLPIKALISVFMVWLAFGRQNKREFCKSLFGFYLISLLCGGIGFALTAFGGFGSRLGAVFSGGVWYLNLPVYRLFLAVLFCDPVLRFVFSAARRAGQKACEIYPIVLSRGKESLRQNAFYDTGNFLEDKSGKGILLAEWLAVARLFPNANDLSDALEQYPKEFRFLRCRGVEGDGVLPAFSARIKVCGQEESETRLVAVTERKLDMQGAYRIILPNDFKGEGQYDGNANQTLHHSGKISISIFQKLLRRGRGKRCGFLYQRRGGASGTAHAGGRSHASAGVECGQSGGKTKAGGT